jgi:S1-C subfamily serine protease
MEKLNAIHTDLQVHIAKDEDQWRRVAETEEDIKHLQREATKLGKKQAILLSSMATVFGNVGHLIRFIFPLLMLVAVSGCTLFSVPPATAKSSKAESLVARAVTNTFALVLPGDPLARFCSGVVAAGVFMTAEHCVAEGNAFEVLYRGKLYPGVVTLTNHERDLAFVDAVGAPVSQRNSVELTTWPVQYGQKVVWTGYPFGTELIMGTGNIGAPTSEIFPGFIPVAIDIVPGNSGGPVFDERGRLIGLVSFILTSPPFVSPMAYVVATDAIADALAAI